MNFIEWLDKEVEAAEADVMVAREGMIKAEAYAEACQDMLDELLEIREQYQKGIKND